MTLIGRFLKIFAGLLALIVLGLFFVRIPSDRIKDIVVEQVADATGRPFRIDGDVSVKLFPALEIFARDVTLGNPAWAKEKSLVSVGTLKARVELRPLLEGEVRVTSLYFDRLQVNLEQRTPTQQSWTLVSSKASSPASASAPKKSSPEALAKALSLKKIVVEASQVNYVDHVSGLSVRAPLERLDLSASVSEGKTDVFGKSAWGHVVIKSSASQKTAGATKNKEPVAAGGVGAQASSALIPAGLVARVDVAAQALSFNTTTGERVSGALAVQDQKARLTLDATVLSGKLQTLSVIDGRGAVPAMQIKMHFNDTYLSNVAVALGKKMPLEQGALEAELQGETRGTGAQLVSHFTGELRWRVSDGKIQTTLFDMFAGDLFQAFFPKTARKALRYEDVTDLSCLIGAAHVRGGRATFKTLVADTTRFAIVGKGTMNLVDRTLDLYLTPEAKEIGLLNLLTPLTVRGSMANPRVQPDERALAQKLATGALAVQTAGVAALAPLLTGEGDLNSVKENLKDVRSTLGDTFAAALGLKAPEPQPQPESAATSSAEQAAPPPPKKIEEKDYCGMAEKSAGYRD